MESQIQERLDALKSQAFKLENSLIEGQKKLIFLKGKIAALQEIAQGETAHA